MKVGVDVIIPKNLIKNLQTINKQVVEPVLVAVATETMHQVSSQKPPPPARGAMRFKSEKQRRFVMAGIKSGRIDVPYKRGISQGSQRLNRSYKMVRSPNSVYLTNTARYARFVIGDSQAQIHKNRWKTATQVFTDIAKSGFIEKVTTTVVRKVFP